MPNRNDIPDTPAGKYLPYKRPEHDPGRSNQEGHKVRHEAKPAKHDPTRKGR